MDTGIEQKYMINVYELRHLWFYNQIVAMLTGKNEDEPWDLGVPDFRYELSNVIYKSSEMPKPYFIVPKHQPCL